MGRLTNGGVIGSVNYPCSYMIDPADSVDLTKGEIEWRRYIKQILSWMRVNLGGFEGIEPVSIALEFCCFSQKTGFFPLFPQLNQDELSNTNK